jgi:hypothetical protein
MKTTTDKIRSDLYIGLKVITMSPLSLIHYPSTSYQALPTRSTRNLAFGHLKPAGGIWTLVIVELVYPFGGEWTFTKGDVASLRELYLSWMTQQYPHVGFDRSLDASMP